jgi:hypothetical protein
MTIRSDVESDEDRGLVAQRAKGLAADDEGRTQLVQWLQDLGLSAVAMALSRLIGFACGVTFHHPSDTWQLLDPQLLEHDLLPSLYHLHTQPPLFNAYVGVLLGLFGSQGFQVVARVLAAATGFCLLLGLVRVLRACRIPPVLGGALVLLFAASPPFIVYTEWLYYTAFCATLSIWCAACLARFEEAGTTRHLCGFAVLVTLLLLTRESLILPWFLVAAAAVCLCLSKPLRARFLLAMMLPLLIVNLLYLKNYLLVGTYSASSWSASSAAHRWYISETNDLMGSWSKVWQGAELRQDELDRLVDRGVLPKEWRVAAFEMPAAYEPFGYFRGVQEGHAALNSVTKADGSVNLNHRDYARISARYGEGILPLIAERPDAVLARLWLSLRLAIQPGPIFSAGLVGMNHKYDTNVVWRYGNVLTALLYLGGPVEPNTGNVPFNIWLVLLPVLLGFGAHRLVRARQGDRRAMLAWISVTAGWLVAVAVGVVPSPNERLRFEADPMLLVLLAMFLVELRRSCWSRWRGRVRCAVAGAWVALALVRSAPALDSAVDRATLLPPPRKTWNRKQTVTGVVHAPANAVFDLLGDPERVAQYVGFARSSHELHPQFNWGEGPPRAIDSEFGVLYDRNQRFRRPRELAFRGSWPLDLGRDYAYRIELTPTGDDTRLSWTWEMDVGDGARGQASDAAFHRIVDQELPAAIEAIDRLLGRAVAPAVDDAR